MQQMELETLRDHLPDDIILHNVLRHVVSTSDYSLVSTYNTKTSIVDFINTANLTFDKRTISKYEDNIPRDGAIGAVVHFTLALSPDRAPQRYSEGIVHIVIQREKYGYVIIECGLKVLYYSNEGWVDLEVEHLMDEYISMNYAPSVTEIINIAGGVIDQCIFGHSIGSILEVCYDPITQVSILYYAAIRRVNDASMNSHVLTLCKSRVIRDLEARKDQELELEVLNLCEYISHAKLSTTYTSAIKQVKQIFDQLL